MSRKRMLSPTIWTNERVVSAQPLARLLFMGLWGEADRAGRLPDRPVTLKMRLLPADTCDVNQLLQELHDLALIERYEADGERFISIPGFSNHQCPHPKEPESIISPPPAVESRGSPRKATAGRGKVVASPSESESLTESLTTHVEQARPPAAVAEVFEHWRRVTGKLKARLDRKRRQCIEARLKDFAPEALRQCIDGYASSAWHRGENDRHREFLGLELLLRDAAHVEAGIELAERPAPIAKPASIEDQPARIL